MAKTSEPFWWSLFAAGGVVAALLTPVTMVITGFLVPQNLVMPAQLYDVIRHPLARLYLLAVIALPLFHGAHRSIFTLVDLGLKPARTFLSVLFYGIAIAGTLLAAWLLFFKL